MTEKDKIKDKKEVKQRGSVLTPGFGPLRGVRVLSCGNVIGGPYAAQLLGEMGAEVIHIERPGVGDMIKAEGRTNGVYPAWAALARNRLSVTLNMDMKNEDSREIFLGLIKKCDIWVENLVWIEKMGITDAMIREANPKIVIVHVSGFGRPQFGGIPEVCDRPSFDVIGQAYSGFMSVQGEEGEMYPITKPTLNDYHTALFAALGALAAYIRARRTGKGDVVDVAQFEADAALLGHFMVSYTVSGELPKRTGNAFTNAPYDLYETGDGRYVTMGTLGKPLYNRALEVMGFDTEEYPFEECGVDPAAMNSELGRKLDMRIRGWMRGHTAAEIEERFGKKRVPASAVNTLADLLENDHFIARGDAIKWKDEDSGKEITGTGVMPKFLDNPGKVWRGAPKTGQDTEMVLKKVFGYDAAKIKQLREDGVI